jgi:hypothetical protein
MPVLNHTRTALRFRGDDLNPDELTKVLGVDPSSAHRKGDARSSLATGKSYAPQKTGLWLLSATPAEPGDLDSQILELLGRLPAELEIWMGLAAYHPDFSIGLFLQEGNEEIGISATVLQAIAARGIELDFDVYGPLRKKTPQPE